MSRFKNVLAFPWQHQGNALPHLWRGKKEIRGGCEFCCFMAAVPVSVNRSRWSAGKGRDGAGSPQYKPRASHNDGATLQLPHCVTAGISWRLNELLTEFPLFCPHLCPISSTSTNIHPSVLVFRTCWRFQKRSAHQSMRTAPNCYDGEARDPSGEIMISNQYPLTHTQQNEPPRAREASITLM